MEALTYDLANREGVNLLHIPVLTYNLIKTIQNFEQKNQVLYSLMYGSLAMKKIGHINILEEAIADPTNFDYRKIRLPYGRHRDYDVSWILRDKVLGKKSDSSFEDEQKIKSLINTIQIKLPPPPNEDFRWDANHHSFTTSMFMGDFTRERDGYKNLDRHLKEILSLEEGKEVVPVVIWKNPRVVKKLETAVEVYLENGLWRWFDDYLRETWIPYKDKFKLFFQEKWDTIKSGILKDTEKEADWLIALYE